MTDIKEQKYCDICGSPKVWCMCDNSIGEPTIQSLASALTIAKMTVAYQRELILKLSEPSPSDVSVTQDVSTDIKTGQSVENTNPDYYKDELYLDEDFRMLAKTYPADVSAIGVTTLIDYVEAVEAELARRDEVIARLTIECDAMAEENRMLSERIQRLVDWHVRAERAEAELAALREKTRWIPVSERLPEAGKPVAILWHYDADKSNAFMGVSKKFEDENSILTDDGDFDNIVTHWMPLPEPTKE